MKCSKWRMLKRDEMVDVVLIGEGRGKLYYQ